MPYLRAYRVEQEAEPDGSMLFVASTSGVKRDGIEIDQGKWRLENYERNPVVLLSHDYMSPPIGTADAYVEDDRLMARVKWDTADPRAAEIAGKYERGVMNTVSVGWDNVGADGSRAKRGEEVVGHELLDISAVSVPGDPDALAQRMLRALREAEPEQDEEARAEVAAEMVAVMDPLPDDSDAEREAAYRALVPKYRHAGMTPPTFRTIEQLRALDGETWGAMFVSGELERVGAVLSKRNADDLATAVELIRGVLKAAAKAKPEETNESERAALAALALAIGDR